MRLHLRDGVRGSSIRTAFPLRSMRRSVRVARITHTRENPGFLLGYPCAERGKSGERPSAANRCEQRELVNGTKASVEGYRWLSLRTRSYSSELDSFCDLARRLPSGCGIFHLKPKDIVVVLRIWPTRVRNNEVKV